MVLSRAAQRDDRVATLPEGMTEKASQKLAATLVERELVREIRAKPGMPVWRRSEEGCPHGLRCARVGADFGPITKRRRFLVTSLASRAPLSRCDWRRRFDPLEPIAEEGEIGLRKLVTDRQHLMADVSAGVAQHRGKLGRIGRGNDRIGLTRSD
jgi:hypothetical protein